jgi:hypothetical protein
MKKEEEERIYIELLNGIEFVQYLILENLKMLNKIVIDQVDEDQKMMYEQVLHIENDQNVFVIYLNVLQLYDQNYVHLIILEQNLKNIIPLLNKMVIILNLKIRKINKKKKKIFKY